MKTNSDQRLPCGGRGPCCHVGYAHRHCQNCDAVIDPRPAALWPFWPNQNPWWTTFGTGWGATDTNACLPQMSFMNTCEFTP